MCINVNEDLDDTFWLLYISNVCGRLRGSYLYRARLACGPRSLVRAFAGSSWADMSRRIETPAGEARKARGPGAGGPPVGSRRPCANALDMHATFARDRRGRDGRTIPATLRGRVAHGDRGRWRIPGGPGVTSDGTSRAGRFRPPGSLIGPFGEGG